MLLELRHINKKFPLPAGQGELTVLENIDLDVAESETVAVVGPSGSGKTTLLNIVGALDKPTSGRVKIAGQDLADLDDIQLAGVRNRDMGFVFQLHHLLPQCTVLENVLVPTIPFPRGRDYDSLKTEAVTLLEQVGLAKHLDYFPAQLSGGELQRTAFVRALINNPKLVLADEPTGSLDRASAENIGKLLVALNKDRGTALIVVTHSLELARLMDKIYVLKNGRLDASSNAGQGA